MRQYVGMVIGWGLCALMLVLTRAWQMQGIAAAAAAYYAGMPLAAALGAGAVMSIVASGVSVWYGWAARTMHRYAAAP